jgi:hypothetical protein
MIEAWFAEKGLSFLVRYVLPVLALGALLWYADHRWQVYQDSLRAEGRAEVKQQWDADIERRRKQVTDVVLLWNQQRERADEQARLREGETNARFAAINTVDVVRVPVVLPADLGRVLYDVGRAANGTGSDEGAAAVSAGKAAAIAVPGVSATYDAREVAEWAKRAGAAYADAANQHLRCVQEYEAISGESK